MGAAGFILICLLSTCAKPRMEGPQIPNPPAGFMYDANASQARNVFPDREIIRQHAWSTRNDDTHSSIYMTEYSGSSSREQVQTARDYQEDRYGGNYQYGPVQDITIYEQPAWGWLETQYHKGDICSLEFKAVVTIENVTHAVEFFSKDPRFMNEAVLCDLVCTFEIGRTKTSWSTVGIVIAIVGLVLVGIRRMTRPF